MFRFAAGATPRHALHCDNVAHYIACRGHRAAGLGLQAAEGTEALALQSLDARLQA